MVRLSAALSLSALLPGILLLGACRTPDKDGATRHIDTGIVPGESGGGAGTDGATADTGSGDTAGPTDSGGQGSVDTGGADTGGEGEGEGAGTGGDEGSDPEVPEEICNGVDDDGDGRIDEDACPDVVITDPDTGRAYMMVEEAMMWFDAAAHCASFGYTLATVDDATENALIWELIYDGDDGVHTVNAHSWIGLHADVGADWAWQDGTPTGGFDASNGTVVTDEYGTATYGQAMAFGDESDATWFEAPQTWFHHAVCESP